MIIGCNKCNKKFDITSNLIPDNGRLVQCSSCKNQWFFKKEKEIDQSFPAFDEKKDDIDLNLKENPSQTSIIDEPVVETDNKKIKVTNNNKISTYKEENKIKKNTKKTNILSLILVFIISMIALIVIVDTFKSPISIIIPNIEYILYNLFESIKDIILFIKDLN